MASNQQPLSSLAQNGPDVAVTYNANKNGIVGNTNFINLILWFIIIGAITYIILYTLKPEIVQTRDATGRPTGQADVSKVLIASIIVALIVVAIIYFINAAKL